MSQNQKPIKFLKFFAFDSANYYLLFIMYDDFIFDESVLINFEHKNFKSLIML